MVLLPVPFTTLIVYSVLLRITLTSEVKPVSLAPIKVTNTVALSPSRVSATNTVNSVTFAIGILRAPENTCKLSAL